jgi:hypothetical protein
MATARRRLSSPWNRWHLLVAMAGAWLAHPGPALAQWAIDGGPVCTDLFFIQRAPQIAPDGASGAFVVWVDLRNGVNLTIYAQRLSPGGRPAPGWPTNGIAVAKTVGHGVAPMVAADGAGGAFVAWYNENQLLGSHIYLQRLTPDGAIAPGWPESGLLLSDAAGAEYIPSVVSDGQGGAIVTWFDFRGSSSDIYAQRVTAGGAIVPGWPSTGVLVCEDPGDQIFPRLVSDGSGGALFVWQDFRDDPRGDIYAQRITASGRVAEGWAPGGAPIATGWDGFYPFDLPVIATDGASGAIIAWQDGRQPDANVGVHALRITARGEIANGWPTQGVLVGRPNFDSDPDPGIVPDNQGGAFVSYVDGQGESQDIYAQHLTRDGQVAGNWPKQGLPVCAQERNQREPVIAGDGAGGGVVAWLDYREQAPDSNPDVYAQRFTADGRIAPGWPQNGVALCAAAGDQISPAICGDGAGGAIATWEDHRGPAVNAADIYAARVLSRGFVPPRVEIEVLPERAGNRLRVGAQGPIAVAILGQDSFDPSTVNPATVTLDGAPAVLRGLGQAAPSPRDANRDRVADLVLRFDADRLDLGPADTLATLRGETWDGIPIEGSAHVQITQRPGRRAALASGQPTAPEDEGEGELALAVTPNPSHGPALAASFFLSSPEPAVIELLDLAGRSLVSQEVGSLGPGRHALELRPDGALGSGIYWIRLVQGTQVRRVRVAIMR